MIILRLTFATVLLVVFSNPAFSQERKIAEAIYRVPLSGAGQSGVCVQGDRLFLTVHKTLEGKPEGGFHFNGNIVGQCFEKATGKLLWEVELPGTYRRIRDRPQAD